VAVLSTLGLAFLLLLAGLEIDLDQLRHGSLREAAVSLVASFAIALVVGAALFAAGLVRSPLLVAIILLATSLGLVVPVLKDADLASSNFGQLVIAAATLADFAAVILLSLLFSREAKSPFATGVLLAGFAVTVVVAALALIRAERWSMLSAVLVRLQDTTAQIRVRGTVLLLLALAALAGRLGIELLLACFMAGVVLTVIDRDQMMSHPQFHLKLEALGYGFLIPVFFVASGIQFDLRALLTSPASLLEVPIFLAAMLAVRGLPATLYVPGVGPRLAAAAGLLQATSLPFIVAATQIGVSLSLLRRSTAAALISAGLLSVVLFPLVALALARSGRAAVRTAARAELHNEEPSP
jgi:Kef-type K+ transport system membrane component KefB